MTEMTSNDEDDDDDHGDGSGGGGVVVVVVSANWRNNCADEFGFIYSICVQISGQLLLGFHT